jgi:hypothetical protein
MVTTTRTALGDGGMGMGMGTMGGRDAWYSHVAGAVASAMIRVLQNAARDSLHATAGVVIVLRCKE